METAETTRGLKLRTTRKSLGWSQDDLAAFLEISQTTISFAERDHAKVTRIYWTVLMDFCDKVDARQIRAEDKPARKGKAA